MESWPAIALVALVSVGPGLSSQAPSTELASRPDPATGEIVGNDTSDLPVLSADGQIVAFRAKASNLVVGDTNGARDVFVRDRMAGTTERVSVSSAGVQGNGTSGKCGFRSGVDMSGNARYVAFDSGASNLVEADTNGVCDVFVRDRLIGVTERVSLPDPSTGNAEANGTSGFPSISDDGRFVAFYSQATNLVTGFTGPGIYVHDRLAGTTEAIMLPGGGPVRSPTLSGDGRFVGLVGLVGTTRNVWVHDRQTGGSVVASVAWDGGPADGASIRPVLDEDGSLLAFQSAASNLVGSDTNTETDVFVRDLSAGLTVLVSVGSGGQGNALSRYPAISDDGRTLVFESYASNLVPGDTNDVADVFVRDLSGGPLERVTIPDPSTGETQSDGPSSGPSLNGDGTVVGFDSIATNLVPAPDNGFWDAFVRVRA